VLALILNALWDVFSYNDFQLPRMLWGAVTGSAS